MVRCNWADVNEECGQKTRYRIFLTHWTDKNRRITLCNVHLNTLLNPDFDLDWQSQWPDARAIIETVSA